MEISDIKEIIEKAEYLGIDEWKDVVYEISNESDDFTFNGYRFINTSEIDRIQCEELENDTYILGCFNDYFIADNTDLSYEIVCALQKANAYNEIGKHIVMNDFTANIQSAYNAADGYGHHFSSYDGSEDNDLDHLGYYIFRID